MTDRWCPICATPLTSSRQRYCSGKCKQAAYRIRESDSQAPNVRYVMWQTEVGGKACVTCINSGSAFVVNRHVTDSTVTDRYVSPNAERLYLDVLQALDDHLHSGGTLQGFGTVLKRVGWKHLLSESALATPLPKLTRAERQEFGSR